MRGADILVRTMSEYRQVGTFPLPLAYHSRSDRHSKVLCWAVLFDLLTTSSILRGHAEAGEIGFGINYDIVDFEQNKRKALDLVICDPGLAPRRSRTFAELAEEYGIVLNAEEQRELEALPPLEERGVGSVRIAFEAKACMTAHSRSLPRLYDELNSSHQVVHGASSSALAVGLVMVNRAETFLSPDSNAHLQHGTGRAIISRHRQPHDAEIVVKRMTELPRRSRASREGFDGLGILVVDCDNQGSPVQLWTRPPAPGPENPLHYDAMIQRVVGEYKYRHGRQ